MRTATPEQNWSKLPLLQEGNQAFAAGNYREAMRAYLLAQALRPGLNAGLEGNLNRCLKKLLDSSTPHQQRLTLPQAAEPLVSILVPMHEQLLATAGCLSAIVDYSVGIAYEVLVLNDASSAATRIQLERIEGLRLINQPRNLGFLHNCNAGAKEARGSYLLWLNNDTLVQPGWLDALLEMAERNPSVGAVGAQLRYPDGRLQEVGGIVWRDGSAARIGDGEWPEHHLTSRPRDVDYCSAAALLVRRSLWEELGGFDPRYAPAYYEDTDLCFRIREVGHRVVVQPKALVVHFEGLSHGRDISQGVKAHQQLNQATFAARWSAVLESEHQHPWENIGWAIDRAQARPMVLVADHKLPEPDRDAGSRSILHLMRGLVRAGVLVKFWPHNPLIINQYLQQLEEEGIEVLTKNKSIYDLNEWLILHKPVLDWILLSRPDVADAVLEVTGNKQNWQLAYYGHDLHYRRLSRNALITNSDNLKMQSIIFEQLEKKIWEAMDVIYYPAADEVKEVQEWANERNANIQAVQIPVYSYSDDDIIVRKPINSSKDKTVLMVAGFAHPPNISAALWMINMVWPLIQSEMPETKLVIAGSYPPQEIIELASHNIKVTGSLSEIELEELYLNSRIAVAPILHGAGVNGKIVEALKFGVPCITTAMGARGFENLNSSILIADNELDFANLCMLLLANDQKWEKQSAAGIEYIKNNFSNKKLDLALSVITN